MKAEGRNSILHASARVVGVLQRLLLIEENFGVMPAYGLLKYRDAVFQVELTDELRARLLELIAAMRRDSTAPNVARSHAEPRRCRVCGYRAECGQSLEASLSR